MGEEQQHYFVVGEHGPPTPETAPHGFRYQPRGRGPWCFGLDEWRRYDPNSKWAPLPAPPTEKAPAPEPEARWTSRQMDGGTLNLLCDASPNLSDEQATHVLDVLNTLDRDGVVYGPGRPMEELPRDAYVLVRFADGEHLAAAAGSVLMWGDDAVCWWPLPGGES